MIDLVIGLEMLDQPMFDAIFLAGAYQPYLSRIAAGPPAWRGGRIPLSMSHMIL